MTQNHAPSARPKSARADATRTHRSQPKPARAQPILLDRLAAALAQQDVSLKRTALQSVAAAAFGFRNANEFAAADLVPADARYLGRSGAAGADLLVLHDPIADKPYAVAPDDPETDPTARARQYGVSPYGHLLALPDLTALEGAVAETPPAKAIQIRYGASLASPEGLITFGGLNMIDLDQRIASYCRATEAGKELFTDADTDADVIRTFLRKVPDAKLNIQSFAPAHAAALAEHADVDTSGLNPFGHLGVVKTPGGDISYFGPTEAVALSKIAAYCRISWSEVADKAGPVEAFTTDEALVNAYFLHQPDETVTLITTPAQIRAEEALAAEAAAQSGSFAAWDQRVAEIRRSIETADPGDHWAEHPVHDLETWRQDVANGDTREGYWPWVAAMIEAAEDDADIDPDDGASPEARVRTVNHTIYTLADYHAHHTVSGEYPRDYDTWVREHVAADTAARDQWLTLDALNQPWSKKLIGSKWDAMLCVHLVTTGSDGRQVVVRKGSVVHVIGHQCAGDPRVTILVAPRVSVTVRPEQRGGYIPLSRAGLRSPIGDLHPLYTRADWVAERGRGARVVAYADWVAEHERLDLRRQQDWFQGGRLSKLNGTQRFTVRVHGIAELPSRAGKPKTVTPYAPGDVVDLHEAEFSGSTGYMILETQDGGRFTLHTRDASGLLPITLLEPQHRVDRRVHPAHDWQAGVKATGLDGVTYQAWLRFVAGSEQRDRWLTMAEATTLNPGDRLTVHVYGETDCQDPRGESFTQTYSPGDTVRFLEATTQDGLVSYAFETEDDGVFTVNLDERGGHLPISQPTAHNAAFDAWLTAVQAEIGPLNQPVQPEDWKRYFHLGYGPVDAVASHRRTRPAIEDPEAFLWQVAEELSRPDLANRADFQDFCAGLKGTVTAAQAAESWTRR